MAHMTLLEELSAGRLSRKAQECAFEKKRESEFHGSCDGQNVNVTGHVAKQGKVSDSLEWSLAWVNASPVDRVHQLLGKLSARYCRYWARSTTINWPAKSEERAPPAPCTNWPTAPQQERERWRRGATLNVLARRTPSPGHGSKSVADELHREREQLQKETPIRGTTDVLGKLQVGRSTLRTRECPQKRELKDTRFQLLRRPRGEWNRSLSQTCAEFVDTSDGLDWSVSWITASSVDRMPHFSETLSAGWCRAQTLSRSEMADRKIDSRTFQTTITIAPSNFEGSFQSPRPMGEVDSDGRKARVGGNHLTEAGGKPPSCRLSFRLAA